MIYELELEDYKQLDYKEKKGNFISETLDVPRSDWTLVGVNVKYHIMTFYIIYHI